MSVMFSKTMFFRELYTLVPGHEEQFVDTYKTEYAAGMQRLGFRLVALWESSFLQGCNLDYIGLWEFERPDQLMQLSMALDSTTDGDGALQATRDRLSALTARRDGWTLLAYPPMSSLTGTNDANTRLKLCLYEEVDLVANQHELFNKALHANYLRLLEGSGIRLVGVLRPQLHSVEAVVLWDIADSMQSLSWLDAIDGSPQWHHWESISQTVRQGWRSRLLVNRL